MFDQALGGRGDVGFGLCCGALVVEVDEEPGVAVGEASYGVGPASGGHGGDDAAVDAFDGRRCEGKNVGHVAGSVCHRAVADADE